MAAAHHPQTKKGGLPGRIAQALNRLSSAPVGWTEVAQIRRNRNLCEFVGGVDKGIDAFPDAGDNAGASRTGRHHPGEEGTPRSGRATESPGETQRPGRWRSPSFGERFILPSPLAPRTAARHHRPMNTADLAVHLDSYLHIERFPSDDFAAVVGVCQEAGVRSGGGGG